jgi:hypothetical protein
LLADSVLFAIRNSFFLVALVYNLKHLGTTSQMCKVTCAMMLASLRFASQIFTLHCQLARASQLPPSTPTIVLLSQLANLDFNTFLKVSCMVLQDSSHLRIEALKLLNSVSLTNLARLHSVAESGILDVVIEILLTETDSTILCFATTSLLVLCPVDLMALESRLDSLFKVFIRIVYEATSLQQSSKRHQVCEEGRDVNARGARVPFGEEQNKFFMTGRYG